MVYLLASMMALGGDKLLQVSNTSSLKPFPYTYALHTTSVRRNLNARSHFHRRRMISSILNRPVSKSTLSDG